MKITDRNKLKKWLDQNYWFEDGFISKIQSDSNGLNITIGLQIKGTYVAGEAITLKEFEIKPENIKKWTFEKSGFKPSYDWCIEGVDLIENDFGLKFETPNLFELICESIDVSEPKEIETYTKPWISDRYFFASAVLNEIPKPGFWIDSFAKMDIEVEFRIYGDNAKEINKIPYPDYSGYFIQKPDRLNLNNYGIFIKSVSKDKDKVHFSFELQDDNLKAEWTALQSIITNWNELIVNCGNVLFKNEEWKDYLDNGKLPRNLDVIKSIR